MNLLLRGGAADASPDAPAAEAGGEFSVKHAFGLGWNVCLLYMSGAAPGWREWTAPPERLPSPSRFTEQERSLIRLGQVRGAISRVNKHIEASGDDAELLAKADSEVDHLRPAGSGAAGDRDTRKNICRAHVALARVLSCSDPRLAKAYHLGVSLATTCCAPKNHGSLEREFNRYRIAQLGEWLADLTALFPDHAGRAVRLSCGTWRRWVEDPRIVGDAGIPGRRRRPLDWDKDGKQVRRALTRQGEVWRALLAGEKPATAMLELHDYVKAGIIALRHGVRLLGGVWPALIAALALLGVGAWLLTKDEGAEATLAGLLTVAGSIGITWKGILGGLGSIAARLQQPVWGAALDEVIAESITSLPAGAKLSTEDVEEAAPASGPQPSVLALPEELEENPQWVV